jgi:hypothetical protein
VTVFEGSSRVEEFRDDYEPARSAKIEESLEDHAPVQISFIRSSDKVKGSRKDHAAVFFFILITIY